MKTLTYEYEENLYINITNLCNNHCEFCLRENSSGSIYADNLWFDGKEPGVEDFWADIEKRDLMSYSSVVFCGYGEPTCRLDIVIELAKRLKETAKIPLRLNTNGLANLHYNRNTVDEITGLIDIVSVSLNADTAKGYDALCHSDYGLDAFKAMLDYTKKCVKNKIKTQMTVVSTMDDNEIENCRIICETLGAKFRVREYIAT